MLPRALVLGALATALAAATPAESRELHWRELDVRTRLESNGTLAVSERHAMVFTGDWNGGERRFEVGFGERLELDGVFRRDRSDGDWRRLERGPLERLDHWNWTDSKTLRWRSRLPSDPPFAGREIEYRIDYRLTGVLDRRGSTWNLDHDFAFADRVGPIERFALALELAPEWSPVQPLASFEPQRLEPGNGYVVTAELEHRGAEAPVHAAPARLPLGTRGAALVVAALGALMLVGGAIRRERERGRLTPLADPAGVDREWIEAHLLTLAPEEVGAAWDESIGAAEVAAMLARLQQEGRIASRVETRKVLFFESTNLHLELLVDRRELDEAERKLIDGLFPLGDRIDTAKLRAHYRSKGFDPAGRIRAPLLRRLGRRPGLAGTVPPPPRSPSVLLLLGGAAALVFSMVASPAELLAPALLGAALVVTWIPAFIGSCLLRERVVGFVGPGVLIGAGLLDGLLAIGLLPLLPQMSRFALGAGVVLFLGLTRTVATALQSRQSAERIERRRELARARAWLAAQLERTAPDLEDAWLPYLVAFGLAPHLDRWFRAHGGTARDSALVAGGSSWSGSGSTTGGGWSGGGGAFGGAGATAGWAAAATSLAAGVSAASSGSGGGGGGGGSSGGGGGGGW